MDNFFRREIKTQYHYAVKTSLLWKIIIDFPHYPMWNNFILEVFGEAEPATRIKFKFQLLRGIMLPATAIILTVESEKEIRWKGRLPIPGLFSAEHYYVLDSNGKPYHPETHSMEEWYNSDYLKDIRRRMLEGEDLPECYRCYDLDDRGSISNRQWSLKTWDNISDGQELKDQTGFTDVTATFSNLCNLKCVMCSPTFSSQHVKEKTKILESGVTDYWHENSEYEEWNADKATFDVLEHSDNIRILRLFGGEPTIMPQFIPLLEGLNNNGSAKNIWLKMTTNVTNINPYIMKLLSGFERVTINISLDGIGDTLEYIRFPAKWSAISKNIKTILSYIEKDDSNIDVVYNFTVQILNIMNFKELVEWVNDEYIEYMTISIVCTLENPKFFDMRLLPLSARPAVIEQMKSLYDLPIMHNEYVDLIINTLLQDVYDDRYPAFWRAIEILETQRGNNLENSNPLLYNTMKPYKNT